MKIGIDLGGSHIGIGVVNEYGKILEKVEVDLINIQNIQNFIIKKIEDTITSYTKKYSNIELIGIACPGTPKQGKLTNIVNLGIKELDIVKILNSKFNIPIKIQNDAKCAGLAEKAFGQLKNYTDSVFLCLGTGIGASVFINNREIKPKRNAGLEIGHMIIEKNGIECNCGKKGCFETYCSIKRLKNNLMKTMNIKKQIPSSELLQMLKINKDKQVQSIINEYIENLNIGISNIVDIFEPQAICFGGSFVYFEEILYKPFVERFYKEKYVFNKEQLPEFKLAILGNDAGIIGSTLNGFVVTG